MYHLLYLAIMQERYYDEVICSIQSFFKVASKEIISNTKILVHTDNRDYFVNRLKLTSTNVLYKTIEAMDFENYDIYLLKIKIIKSFKKCHNEPCLLLDSDTFFLTCPKVLFHSIEKKNAVVMCLRENTIEEKIGYILQEKFSDISQTENNHKAFYSDIKAGKTFQSRTNQYVFDKDAVLWNSGVIGLGANIPTAIFVEIEELASMLYNTYHYRVSEQFALSYLLGRKYKILSADSIVFHYWFSKNAMQILWNYFYEDKKYGEQDLIVNTPYDQLYLVLLTQFYKQTDRSIVNDILLDHPKDSLVYKSLNRLLQEVCTLYVGEE